MIKNESSNINKVNNTFSNSLILRQFSSFCYNSHESYQITWMVFKFGATYMN